MEQVDAGRRSTVQVLDEKMRKVQKTAAGGCHGTENNSRSGFVSVSPDIPLQDGQIRNVNYVFVIPEGSLLTISIGRCHYRWGSKQKTIQQSNNRIKAGSRGAQ